MKVLKHTQRAGSLKCLGVNYAVICSKAVGLERISTTNTFMRVVTNMTGRRWISYMNNSDTVYEYKKIKPLELDEALNPSDTDRDLKNKINELLIEQNKMAKDFELYKGAHMQLTREFNALITLLELKKVME